MPRVRCLSIRQPAAELVLRGEKLVENRSWRTKYRGWLAIHASANQTEVIRPSDDGDDVADLNDGVHPDDMTFGALLGFVELVDCCRPRDLPQRLKNHRHSNKSHDNWCWIVGKPTRLKKPLKTKGKVGYFYTSVPALRLPKAVAAALRRAKEES